MRKIFATILLGSMILGSCLWGANGEVKAADLGTNLIVNSTFDIDLACWGTYSMMGGVCEIGLENGALKAEIQKCGEAEYSVQVYYDGFRMYQNGEYALEFDISSSLDRKLDYRVQMNGGDYRAYAGQKINIGSEMETVSFQFTMKDETDFAPRLAFNLGSYENEELDVHDIKIDNVKLYLIDDTNVDYGEAAKNEKKVVINQVGYKPEDKKIAVFKGEEVGQSFSVVSQETGESVYIGQIYGKNYNEAAAEVNSFGDFSKITQAGQYRIVTEEIGDSYTFTIGEDIYDNVFKDAVRFFYLQRCGEEIPEALGDTWSHAPCHTELARIYGTNEMIDVSGGWHDAGDYGRYVVASSKAIADLLSAYEENKEAFGDDFDTPESGNGIPDILDEIKYQLQWMLKMQEQTSGGVYHKVTCAEFPGYVMPEEEINELIVCPISTTATGDFTAVMAMGYEYFKDIDAELARQCLVAAEKAWNYLENTPSSCFTNPEGIVTGEYIDPNDSDERYWAAAQLFKATGDSKYDEIFKGYVREGIKKGYSWADVGSHANIVYLKAEGADPNVCNDIKNSIINEANDIVALAKNDGYGISNGTNYYWGSNMNVMNNAIVLAIAYEIVPNEEYMTYAKEHMNYCFGKNSLGFSYVTGYGTDYVENPHHRPSIAKGTAIPGMLAGGPNKNLEDPHVKSYRAGEAPARCYLDHQESYSTNEVDIYWNSPFVYALSKIEVE